MRELFIYYRVRSIGAAAAEAAVLDLQAQLRHRFPQLKARLLRRPEEVDGLQTWMETYSTDPLRDPTGIDAGLQSEIEARALTLLPLLDGPRHTEVFIACVS
jgi:Domain of unknown function (DUF4936)